MLIIIFGFLFGAVLQYARLNKFDVISGMATLDDYAVAKAIAFAIGLGAILINIEIGLGLAAYHVKPMVLGGIMIGGIIFGIGMAILGYCPGTLAISLGEGAMDALLGVIGGLLGGLVYTLVLPFIKPILGPNLGKISLNSLMGAGIAFYIIVIIAGFVFMAIAFWLNAIEKVKNNKWLYSGIGLAILEVIVFSKATTNRPIGASTMYPYLADLLSSVTHNAYFAKIQTPGYWEFKFLIGSFLAGFVGSLVRRDFKLVLIHERWKQNKGTSSIQRVIWSFIGGFILIFGARMAGGCTSGHVLSGGMQLAISSLVFGVFVFAGLLVTGKLFYKKP